MYASKINGIVFQTRILIYPWICKVTLDNNNILQIEDIFLYIIKKISGKYERCVG